MSVTASQAAPAAETALRAPLLEVANLDVRFVGREGTTRAVNGVSFAVAPGEVVCLIGESGSGKSVTLQAIMQLLPRGRTAFGGSIHVDGRDVLALDERAMHRLRGREIALVPQEPMTALDPVYTIGAQIAEAVRRHEHISRRATEARALELLRLVHVPSPEAGLRAYPHELSGGLRQRVLIAIALSCRPKLLLADEPTTALDATVQIQVLILLRQLQAELGMGVVLVTHDLGVAAQVADRIAVMYAGRIVEEGTAEAVLGRPAHPYTRGLLASTVTGHARDRDITIIPGSPPDGRSLPPGCAFAPRCRFMVPACLTDVPSPVRAPSGSLARCIRLDAVSASP